MQKVLIALSSNPKSTTVKAGNQFNGYEFNFTHNQKMQNKNKLCVYFKTKLPHFQIQGV